MATNSPYSRYYTPVTKPLTGNVQVPGPNDPVDVSRQGNTTYMDFGIDAQNAFGNLPAPVTQSERGAEALLRAMGRIPDMPRDLMRMNLEERQKIGALPQFGKPEKPTESYGLNRGGSGKAGRGTGTMPQFGQSQFDTGAGYEPLEMKWSEISDKPWELDENTNVDVSPGTSLTPKPETNIVDKEPDLQSPRGMYEALAKKYPDLLTQNLDQLQQGRVTMEDVDALRDQSGLGSLFIAASKAASGAGSIGGKTAESIAPTIVQREDTLARQRLKDRMDVASENMALNAKAVDLAMKQINFADEREQYDPNSEVSKFARQFMRDEFHVNVPDDVPAYQLKQFLPAVVQKYQAQETGAYRNAMLGQRTQESALVDAYKRWEAALKSGDKEKELQAKKDIANINAKAKVTIAQTKAQTPKAAKTPTMFGETTKEQMKAEMDLAKAFSNEDVVKSFSKVKTHANRLFELAKNPPTASNDEALIVEFNKVIDEGSVVKEGEFARTAEGGGLWTKWKNQLGRYEKGTILQPSQRNTIVDTVRTILSGIRPAYEQKKEFYKQRAGKYKLDPAMIIGVDEPTESTGQRPTMLPSGRPPLTDAERARLKRLQELKGVK